MHVIGEDTAERLDVIPAQYRVIVTHRPQYACRACEQAVVQAPAPERLIRGGLPTEAMVAAVLVAKYAWHLPLYRQSQMLLSQGIAIERATLAFWVGYAAAELKPLHLRLRELILGSAKIAVDETVAPVLDPGRGRTKKGYFWAIARDDRPWGGTDPPAVAYTYAPGRGAVHGLKLLESYRGIVQCDGYAAYKNIAEDADRRRDYACLLLGSPEKTVLRYRKGRLGADRERGSGTHRRALCDREDNPRQKRRMSAAPCARTTANHCCCALKTWLELQLARVSTKSVIADVIRYGLNHWDGLVRFLDDGRIELDTNIVERSIRPIVLNRKNALFAGHDQGAENWAAVATLVETCKLHGVDPQAYFADVLTKLVNLWPASRLDELMPWVWGKPNNQSARGAGAGRRMTAVDPITTWSSFLASPAAPKTAMSTLELDGYLTGVIVTPQAVAVPPSAWIGRLWGDDDPIFADEAQINAALGAVALRYNTLIRDIDRSLKRMEADRIVDIGPCSSRAIEAGHDAVRAGLADFWKAMTLAPATWSGLVEDEGKVVLEPFVGFFDSTPSIPTKSPPTSTLCSTPRPP